MKYKCKQCERTFETRGDADAHEYETGHRVELLTSPTYWGAHLVTH
ncbi:MAG: hypothetical protein JRN52_01300 [Nitrososphaerota archaeon]|nr:hypothetical protein [Nitrososphaerota archaeon]